MTRSEKFIRKILVNEGGAKVTNDSADAGGLTKYGICQKSFPNLDIQNLTERQAIDIYTKEYCIPCKVDAFTDELLALHLFDFAVNSGVTHSIKTLQTILNVVSDGILGNISINAANNDKTTCSKFIIAREDFYCKLAAQSLQHFESAHGKATYDEKMTQTNYKFLNGWINRVKNLYV